MMKKTWMAVVTVCIGLVTLPAQSAGFNCAYAKLEVEKMICADAELSSLDSELAKRFTAIQDETKGIDGDTGKRLDPYGKEQARWLKEVRNKCEDALCVRDAYKKRLQYFGKVEKDLGLLVAACVTQACADGLVKQKVEGSQYFYSGSVLLEGEYVYARGASDMDMVGDQFCFTPTKLSAKRIPRERGDDRSRWFCFENTAQAKRMFNVLPLLKQKQTCELKGKATVQVDRYIADLTPSDVNDTARLLKVVRLGAPRVLPYDGDSGDCRR
ncbi:lysozyme inhibitor LprI family protein [Chromobacterium sp. LK1]|uniref:lysozyme inhibitor LprI family protein n=1 Tax=Chromobacterium sp. LK1 TaxID=1628193 RepID=UPI0012E17238|nr:lysozyme inhibitor LprI family protein [Chromobacterium sp. LK1]